MNYTGELQGFRNEKISTEDCIITDIRWADNDLILVFAEGIMAYSDDGRWERTRRATLRLRNCLPDDVMCWKFRSFTFLHRAWGIASLPDFEKIASDIQKGKYSLFISSFMYTYERLMMRCTAISENHRFHKYRFDFYCDPVEIQYEYDT